MMLNITPPTAMNKSQNVSSFTIEEFEHEQFLQDDLLVVSYLILLSVVGTIGNGHALVVYLLRYKPSNHRTFVLWLSVVDLLACCLGIPFEIFDLRYSYTFSSSVACKIFRYLNHFVSVGSGLLLGVIALERHRKVCKPFKQQMDEKCAMKACVITICVALVLSAPAFVFYGAAGKTTDTQPILIGTDCTVFSYYKDSMFFFVFSGLFLLISTAIFIMCVIAYVLVGRVMYKQMIFRKSAQIVGKKNSNGLSTSNSHENGGYVEDESSVNTEIRHKITMQDRKPTTNFINSVDRKSTTNFNSVDRKSTTNLNSVDRKPKVKKKFVLDRSKRITLMFLVATAVSYVGYLPYNIIIFIKVLNPKAYGVIKGALGQFMPILLRGYFLNNASNPVVYCFLDNRFRTECKRFYTKMQCYLCKKREKGYVY